VIVFELPEDCGDHGFPDKFGPVADPVFFTVAVDGAHFMGIEQEGLFMHPFHLLIPLDIFLHPAFDDCPVVDNAENRITLIKNRNSIFISKTGRHKSSEC
jgi:hypothetical protein